MCGLLFLGVKWWKRVSGWLSLQFDSTNDQTKWFVMRFVSQLKFHQVSQALYHYPQPAPNWSEVSPSLLSLIKCGQSIERNKLRIDTRIWYHKQVNNGHCKKITKLAFRAFALSRHFPIRLRSWSYERSKRQLRYLFTRKNLTLIINLCWSQIA